MHIPSDVINHLAGIAPGSRLDAMRSERPEARENAQNAFLALFAPDSPGDVDPQERFALGLYTALLHQSREIADFYAQGLAGTAAPQALMDAVWKAAEVNPAKGPYGAYPPGPLSKENETGPAFTLPPSVSEALGPRLSTAFAQTFMLVFHPRDAKAEDIQTLFDAGWSTGGLVTISQLVTFLAYQIRLVLGLRAMQRSLDGGEGNG